MIKNNSLILGNLLKAKLDIDDEVDSRFNNRVKVVK